VAAEIQASLLPRSPAQYRVTIWQAEPNRAKPWAAIITTRYDGSLLHLALGTWLQGVGAAMLMVELRATVRANWQQGRWLRPRPESTATFISTFPLTGTRPSFSAPQHDLWVRIGADDEGWDRNRRVT